MNVSLSPVQMTVDIHLYIYLIYILIFVFLADPTMARCS